MISYHWFRRALSLLLPVFVMACGGSEAPGTSTAPTPGPTPTPTPTATQLQITASRSSLTSAAGQTATITVTALSASNNSVSGVPVSLSADSGILQVTGTGTTDSTGQVAATFSLGQDRANRAVTITATSGNLPSVSTTIQVTGSTLTLTPTPSSTVASASDRVTLVAAVQDAASQPLGNVRVRFATSQGTLDATEAITDAGGVASVVLSGVTSQATVTATGVNISRTATVNATSQTLPDPSPAGVQVVNFVVQANPTVIGPNSAGNTGNASEVRVTVLGNVASTNSENVPVQNARVLYRILNSPPLGSLSVDTTTSPALTSEAGVAINSFVAGAATSGADGVTICVRVVGFTPPPPTGDNLNCASNERGARLSIAQQPLFVRISFNNRIAKVDEELNYEKAFSVSVTDAVGRGVSGVRVTATLLPRFYFKASYRYSDGAWRQGSFVDVATDGVVTTPPDFRCLNPAGIPGNATTCTVPSGPTQGLCASPRGIDADSPACMQKEQEFRVGLIQSCTNEDLNFNGILDATDNDENGDGRLWPGQVAAATVENSGLTDSTGFAILRIKYGQLYATWVEYDIQVTASVGGSEGRATLPFVLSPEVGDVTSQNTPGSFVTSPYGVSQRCRDRL